jgi:hypothetical protein
MRPLLLNALLFLDFGLIHAPSEQKPNRIHVGSGDRVEMCDYLSAVEQSSLWLVHGPFCQSGFLEKD